MVNIEVSVGALAILISILVAPPICMIITGFLIRKDHKKSAKKLFISAGIYLLIFTGLYCFLFMKLFVL